MSGSADGGRGETKGTLGGAPPAPRSCRDSAQAHTATGDEATRVSSHFDLPVPALGQVLLGLPCLECRSLSSPKSLPGALCGAPYTCDAGDQSPPGAQPAVHRVLHVCVCVCVSHTYRGRLAVRTLLSAPGVSRLPLGPPGR